MEQIDVKNYKEFDNHERVIKVEDDNIGLKAYIAIHNSNLGPAIGGTRMYNYRTEKEAISDALNLSKAMTYKCALSGIKQGGGKGIIIGDPKIDKTEELIRTYAKKIDELGGSFITGEDVGLSEEDVQVMFEESNYFVGKSGLAGDPSPFAAQSVFYCMQAAIEDYMRATSFDGVSVAVKGVGKVGSSLVDLLVKAGAKVAIADIDDAQIDKILRRYSNIEVVHPKDIHRFNADIFAPCALGGDINDKTVLELKAKIICGGANNQLAQPEVGDRLHKKGILYVVDYVANAGGLINVVDELEEEGYSKERVMMRIQIIKDTIKNLIALSEDQDIATSRFADMMAKCIFNKDSNA
ncbi:MAG: Glu/Leu/Phe/Val dehydrogenase [Candidatus Kerfeldbacteria bacterium]|nr:Glu/Leu/Phe/Val dehydrogenase [Candidatus Kerfeldbacteria bacterium]